jgi:hypothetical protein
MTTEFAMAIAGLIPAIVFGRFLWHDDSLCPANSPMN